MSGRLSGNSALGTVNGRIAIAAGQDSEQAFDPSQSGGDERTVPLIQLLAATCLFEARRPLRCQSIGGIAPAKQVAESFGVRTEPKHSAQRAPFFIDAKQGRDAFLAGVARRFDGVHVAVFQQSVFLGEQDLELGERAPFVPEQLLDVLACEHRIQLLAVHLVVHVFCTEALGLQLLGQDAGKLVFHAQQLVGDAGRVNLISAAFYGRAQRRDTRLVNDRLVLQ